MKRSPVLHLLGFGTLSFVLMAQAAFASGGEAHIENFFSTISDSHAPDLGFMLVTFSVFAFVLYKFGVLKLKAYVEVRHVEIKNAIEKAQKAKAQADAAKAAFEERLKGLDTEIEKLRSDFLAQGEREKQRLEASGQAAAARIKSDAQETIAQEKYQVEVELKNELIRNAFAEARKQIESGLSSEDHKNLETSFVNELAQEPQNTGGVAQ